MPLCHEVPSLASTTAGSSCGFWGSTGSDPLQTAGSPRSSLPRPSASTDAAATPYVTLPRTPATPRRPARRPRVDPQPQRAFKRPGYELEKARAERSNLEHQELFFEYDPWRSGQCAPPILQEPPRANTPFRLKNFAYRESPLRTTIGEYLTNDTRLPYAPLRDHLPVRESVRGAPARVALGTPRNFDHTAPNDEAPFGSGPKPLTSGEPYLEIARYSFRGKFPPPAARLGRRKVPPIQADKPKCRRAVLSAEALAQVRTKLKAAAYAGTDGHRLDLLFQRVDKDSNGYLDKAEVKEAFRKVLRIAPKTLCDEDIANLVKILDRDGSGGVSLEDLVDFIGPEQDAGDLQGGAGGQRETAMSMDLRGMKSV